MTIDELRAEIVAAALACQRTLNELEEDDFGGMDDVMLMRMSSEDRRLQDACNALLRHEASERERIEERMRNHAFEPGDPGSWSRYEPHECDVCGKSEAEHGSEAAS